MANEDQAEFWNGPAAQSWVEQPERYDRMLAEFGADVLRAAALVPGEHVLDVGCGAGALTLAAAAAVGPGGAATGVDIAAPMLDLARRRAFEAEHAHVAFLLADAQTHPFPPAHFDVVTSRFGVMFFDDPAAAFANLRRAVKPGGRLAFACWQSVLANDWMMVPLAAALSRVPSPPAVDPTAPGPFAFGDADRVRSILAAAGWVDVDVEGIARPLRLAGGGGLDEVMAFLAASSMVERILTDAPAGAREAALDAIADALAPHATADAIELGAASWLVRARAGG